LEERLTATKALQDYVGTESPRAPALLGHLIADAERARAALPPGSLVTDDRCFLEYSAPRSMGRDTRPQVLEWLDGLRRDSPVDALYAGGDDRLREEIRRRRDGRRALAEAVRLHVDDPDRALEALERSPAPLPRDPRTAVFLDYVAEAVLFRAQSRLRAMDPRSGIELLRRIPRGATCYPAARILLGETLTQSGRPDEARRAYLEAREADPTSADAAAGLARSYQIDQKYEDAARVWPEVIALRPDSSVPHVQLALCFRRLNRVEEARAECRRALDLNPNDRRAADLLETLGKP
jgi:tetratricopeptide (TPR) repeat protein